jgi:MFS family permease
MTDFSKLARRITIILFVEQSLASAGNIAAATVNPIVGAQLAAVILLPGVPTAVYLLGAAFAASAWGYIMDRIGRRNGIVLGLRDRRDRQCDDALMRLRRSSGCFWSGMALTGATNAAVVLARFAAAR